MKVLLFSLVLIQVWMANCFPKTCPYGAGTGMSAADRIKGADIVVQVQIRGAMSGVGRDSEGNVYVGRRYHLKKQCVLKTNTDIPETFSVSEGGPMGCKWQLSSGASRVGIVTLKSGPGGRLQLFDIDRQSAGFFNSGDVAMAKNALGVSRCSS